MWCVIVPIAAAFTQCISAPPLTGVQRYSALNVVTRLKYTTIIFDFYTGLAHMYSAEATR